MWGARRTKTVLALLVGLILCGILRSAIATRLDSFDIDEAYHITAGVTYVRLGDYRLNPEHPPLIKLWVGAFLTPSVFKTPQLRPSRKNGTSAISPRPSYSRKMIQTQPSVVYVWPCSS